MTEGNVLLPKTCINRSPLHVVFKWHHGGNTKNSRTITALQVWCMNVFRRIWRLHQVIIQICHLIITTSVDRSSANVWVSLRRDVYTMLFLRHVIRQVAVLYIKCTPTLQPVASANVSIHRLTVWLHRNMASTWCSGLFYERRHFKRVNLLRFNVSKNTLIF